MVERRLEEAFTTREGTSPDVWPMLHRLKSLCKATEQDSESMRDLKAAFSVSLDEKYIIHPLHKLATLISPTFKYLTFVDAAERDEIYAQMRAKVDSLPSIDETDVSAEEPCAKKQKLEPEDLLLDYRTTVSVPELAGDTMRHELDKYMSLPLTEQTALEFWKIKEKQLPRMAAIAKQLLAIPATSTASERVFSLCGNTLSERRARMQPETLEKLMFLRYNM